MEFTATASNTGGTFARELHRLNDDGDMDYRMPDFDTEYGVPDPKRYTLEFVGFSDVFEEADMFNEGEFKDRVVCEFKVVGSKKWQGTRFSMAMNLPMNWTDDRSKLHQLFSALQGRPIVQGDVINFEKSLGKTFEGVVANKTSAKGRDYALITTFLALDQEDEDDDIPTRTPTFVATQEEAPF